MLNEVKDIKLFFKLSDALSSLRRSYSKLLRCEEGIWQKWRNFFSFYLACWLLKLFLTLKQLSNVITYIHHIWFTDIFFWLRDHFFLFKFINWNLKIFYGFWKYTGFICFWLCVYISFFFRFLIIKYFCIHLFNILFNILLFNIGLGFFGKFWFEKWSLFGFFYNYNLWFFTWNLPFKLLYFFGFLFFYLFFVFDRIWWSKWRECIYLIFGFRIRLD